MTALPIQLMTEDEVAGFGRREDAGFGALETSRGLLPLTAMDVDARVAGVIASIEIAQTFVNTIGVAIEATYIFPLPDRAAVHRFRMEVGGRVIEGVVDERGAAREEYEQAIAAGHRAAITEQERPGVFTLRVGNLMPGEAATVRLSLVGPLPIDDGEVTFRFPLVVAPRYIPGAGLPGDQAGLGTAHDTDIVPDASRISPPVLLAGCPNPVRLGLRVALEDRGVRELASSLHGVTEIHRDARVVEIRPGERLDRDFILRWRIDDNDLRSTLVCADDADGRAGTFMLTFVPPSTAAVSAKPRDVVFVLDRSGSMQGWKMVAARRAVARMIDTLTSRDRFHVIAFDNAVEALPEARPVAASDRNRFAAIELLAKVDARGGTELAAPLQLALGQLAGGFDDRERVVVLVTDGQVGNEDHILRMLGPSLRNVRVFTLGIDQAVNAGFLRQLAGASGGLCELVESEDRLDAVMAKVHRRIGTPIATELSLTPTGIDVDRATIAPKRLPDVYAGAPVTVLGRYRGAAPAGATIHIDATSFGDPLKLAIAREARTADPREAAWLAASWARAQIRELEDRYSVGQHDVEPEIIRISKLFGVLSRFTAYLAIDRSEIANAGGKLHQVVQPVDKPAGWDMHASTLPRSRMIGGMGGGVPMMPGAMPPPAPAPAQAMGAPPKVFASAMPPMAQEQAKVAKKERRESITVITKAVKRDNDLSGAAPSEALPDASAFLAKLGVLARELEAKARAADATAIRLIRQRLTEWVEDLRSVGGHHALAALVDVQLQRLSAAITRGANLAADALAIAGELAKIAGGAPPPATKSRVAFWK